MGLEKPTSIVAMLRIFFRPITAKGGCAFDTPSFVVVVVVVVVIGFLAGFP